MRKYMGIFLFIMIFLGGCAATLTRGSSVIVGNTRTPINSSQVKLYNKAPAKYEEIALVSADSRNDFDSKQGLTDAAIERLKEEAAKVGANGVLLSNVGDYVVGSSGLIMSQNGNNNYSTMGTSVRTGKEVKGTAIYVK